MTSRAETGTPGVTAVLLDVLRTCLDNDDIGDGDNFFAMGGDSILALNVIAMAREHGLRIELRDLLTRSTVHELAETAVRVPVLEAGGGDADPFSGLTERDRGLLPAGVVAAQPASALQTGLIYLVEVADGAKPYNDFIGLRVLGAFDERAMRGALTRLMHRHRVLRSAFDLDTFAQPAQLFWAEVEPPLEVDTADAEHADQRVHAWRERILSAGIDWAVPPAFRCHVVAAPDLFRLSLAVHHSIVDGWSFALIMSELLACYDAELGNRDPGLPPVPERAHGEFATLERAAVASLDSVRFWLEEADTPPLLFDRARFAAAANPESLRFLPISPSRLAGLRAAADGFRVPLKSLLLAAHGWALGRWTGRADVVTGLVVNGRPEVEHADRLVGLFLNTIPVRLRSLTGSWAELATGALSAERRALPHRRYPLERIEHALGRPAFDVSFNFAHFHMLADVHRLPLVRVDSWWTYDKASTPMMVSVGVDVPGSGTNVRVAYDQDFLAPQRVDEFLSIMAEALDTIAGGASA